MTKPFQTLFVTARLPSRVTRRRIARIGYQNNKDAENGQPGVPKSVSWKEHRENKVQDEAHCEELKGIVRPGKPSSELC